ncbi:ATP synthase F1 subcomplex epsilon subunit [Tistlia consotensis]|uniref:ATP synthase epsilon chain n=1 Tax=Tistlia consotensis USBA 355 TaxID=560819 RepID=A0A1Y6BGR6_9PROT|nr:F0F1 ATP synthase subunit epsilon [Tistlia consotensis]SMF08300.1 ATP synthase F1 subcomplex epsilon subunit [Tistlia consotensis USBA 355]SNR35465.1 ATP synthase F1 subcomplex epsilon subunit [Tistlia consotensis]
MAEMVAFELVSPEELLISEDVAMVVVPGEEGDFGVLPRHAPLISSVRPGVISVYQTRQAVTERIFVAGGFAEVTPERCTVLAELAIPVDKIDRADAEQRLKDAREDLADAKDELARSLAAREIAIREAMIKASEA